MPRDASNTLHDSEFGPILLRRMKQAKYVRLRIKNDGTITVTLPYWAAPRHALELLEQSRVTIRKARQNQNTAARFWRDGDPIGMVYRLRIIADETVESVATIAQSTQAVVRHHPRIEEAALQQTITSFVAKLLRKQAMAYLPRRLKALAEQHGFYYNRVRFSSAETRWGSCSSEGTISLNIWLMTLGYDMIDYVLVHELCHTRHMNHSRAFWQEVETCLPNYQTLRRAIKQHSPNIGAAQNAYGMP